MVESMTDLHLLPPKGFRLWVVPMKIDRGTGAPTRSEFLYIKYRANY